jgi:filamentous hemagglutinin family protein
MHRHASLNRIFRLVWSHVHQAWVAVSETSRGRGKCASRKLLLAAAALAAAQLAQAGPLGGQVTNGAGAITQSGTTTTINQSSQNLALAWNSFNTSASETVNFIQPSRSAVAVNRIFDTSATQFFGKLNANGQVWLVNPNGVLLGAGAQVNVGGLVASTLDIDDASVGSAARRFSGNGTGSVVNQGAIAAADGGYVAFIGNRVSNQGTVDAPRGSVALGAGSDVTLSFAGNSLVGMQVNRSTLDNLAENGGLVRAEGGAVILSAGAKDAVLASVVNNTGIIEAKSAREVGGVIVLDGGQNSTAMNSGTLDASGAAGAAGGTVKVLGQEVQLAASSRIDVSGDTQGGTAYIGGNFLGSGPERNAQNTSVAAGSTALADALGAGHGGKVAVWSDGTTRFDGRISARGGAAGGNGGNVETSGKNLKIGKTALVDTLAPRGVAGDWLLDPQDLTIGGYDGIDGDITGGQISQALNTSNVTIKTGPTVSCTGLGTCPAGAAGNGDIIVLDGVWIGGYFDQGGVDYHWTAPTTLTLSAYRNVEMKGYSSLDWAGPGTINLRADNTATGVGTVILGPMSSISAADMGTLNIYYNPTSYATPTPYATQRTADNESQVINNTILNTYMYVNVIASVANKTYDGTTAATLNGVPTTRMALPSGVTIDTSGATASFTDRNAGANKATTITGVALGGPNAAQYAINGLGSTTATINKANLAVTGISANNKTYNGTTAATLSGSATVNAFGADAVGVAGSGIGNFADKNAGTGKAVTVTGYTLAGAGAGNYNLIQPTGLTATINKANLAVSGIGAATKTYDGTTAATLAGTATVAAFGSDIVSVGGAGTGVFADKNAGANKAVTVTGYSLAGLDAGNYNIVQPNSVVASVNKANLAISGIGALDKTYDATTAATLSGSATVAAFGADAVAVSGTGTGTFATRIAGAGKAVTVSGYTLTGLDAGNYNLLQPAGVTASIAKASVMVSGVTASNKSYDGTRTAAIAGTATVAALGSDTLTVGGTGAGMFADKNVGSGKAVTVAGFTLGGMDAGNYNLLAPAGLTANIIKYNLAVSGLTANNKTYDGTTAATLGGSATVNGYGSDAITVQGTGAAVFANKNAGTGKAVTVTGLTLAGADAGNYNLVQPTSLTATINKASLAIGGLSASDKVYDASVAATLGGTATVTALGADVVGVSGAGSAAFADKNVGAGKTVVVSGFTLTGADAGNYNLAQPAGLVASISRASLALGGITANNKTYDATTAATLAGTATVTALGSDVVTVGGAGTAAFADKNAGLGKAVTVGGYTLAGPDAGNYTLVAPAGFTANIARANLAVNGITANSKTYDATTAATLAGTASVAALGADAVNVTGTGTGTGVFTNKNAGAGKAVSVTGFSLAGLDAANYNIVQPAGLTASIGKANLAITGVAASDKVYDATVAATLSGTATVTGLAVDAVGVGGTGAAAFANKNAGAGKAVAVTGFTLTGADAGNYNVVQPTGLTANIGKASLALGGITASSKTYDGTTAATLAGTASVAALAGDAVTVAGTGSGSFADKNAGAGKAVTVGGYTLAGLDAGNYTLVAPAGLTASIARANLAVGGITANDKTYDATTSATLGGAASVAAIGLDAVSVMGAGTAVFANKNAGTGKAVTVSGFSLAGADAANYNVVQPAGLTATINKANLAIAGVSASDKVYDATVGATLTGSATVAALGSDVVGIGGAGAAAFADKNAGLGKTVVVSGFALTGADAGNYNLAQPSGLTANIAKASLALAGVTANGKTYDGTTAATLAGSASVAAFAGDAVSVAGSGAGAFADRNAGLGKAVTVGGYTLAGVDAGNYTLVLPVGLTADIARASLAVSGVTAADKAYDTTVAATLAGNATVTAFGADVVSLAGTGTGVFADRNAGANKAVAVSGFSLSGADAANYDIVQPSGLRATIGRANLAIGGLSASDKVYDATVAANLAGTATVAALGSDAVSIAGAGTAVFADKNAGAGKTVIVSGYTLNGADAGNYNLAQPTGLTAGISQASLALTGLVANSKTYDGTTAATLAGTAAVAAIAGDMVRVTGAGAGTFVDKNAGFDKSVAVSGYTLTGQDAGNYALVAPANMTAAISRANLTVTGVAARDKTYDATNSATLAGTAAVAAFGSDDVRVRGSGSAAFADKNAGSGKAVTVSGYALGGLDAGNYNVVQPTGMIAAINKADIAIGGVSAVDKVYDGTVAAGLAGTATVAAFGSDVVSVDGAGAAAFADKNAGAGKAVTVTGFTLGGVDAANYNAVLPAALRATISQARLAVSGITASDKAFDGTTAATVSTAGAVLAGKIGADSITLTSTGAFADAAAGAGKTVILANTYGGVDAGNYAIVDQATTVAGIAALPVAPVTPVTPAIPAPAATEQVREAVVQVQSTVLAPQASSQPQALTLASTVNEVASASDSSAPKDEKARDKAASGLIDTRFGAGANAPTLQIQDGGVQLPPLASNSPR